MYRQWMYKLLENLVALKLEKISLSHINIVFPYLIDLTLTGEYCIFRCILPLCSEFILFFFFSPKDYYVKLSSLSYHYSQDPTLYNSKIILEMLHSEQAVMFNIFVIRLSSHLFVHISLIKVYANIALSIRRHCVFSCNEGTGGRGQPTQWNKKVLWVQPLNKYLFLLTMFIHWFVSPSHAGKNIKEKVFLV